jgi:hypothetical protein
VSPHSLRRISIAQASSSLYSKYGDYSRANLKSWITILRYATRWEFDEVKELAIRYIASLDMDVIERIVLYQENRLPEKYLFPLYMQIASREGMLGLDESRALGYETLVLIHHARERLRAPTPMNNKLLSPIRTDLKSTDVIDIVASTFNISLTNANSNTGNPVFCFPSKSGLTYIFPPCVCRSRTKSLLGRGTRRRWRVLRGFLAWTFQDRRQEMKRFRVMSIVTLMESEMTVMRIGILETLVLMIWTRLGMMLGRTRLIFDMVLCVSVSVFFLIRCSLVVYEYNYAKVFA